MKRWLIIGMLMVMIMVICMGCGTLGAQKGDATATVQYEREYKLTDGKKAIIIIPGLLAGGLWDVETQEPLWDPVKSDEVDLLEFMGVYDETHVNITVDSLAGEFLDLFDYVGDVLSDNENSIMRRIMCDDKGDPAPHVAGVPMDYPGHLRYGAMNSYKWWAEGLRQLYGDEYEVVVFNYNWLTDTRYAVRDFAEFMRAGNYTQTILIGHSMGGIVANQYLAMGAQNRARVDKFIAVAVPFYGSYMATSTLENPYVFMDLINWALDSDMIKGNELLAKLDFTALKEKVTKLYDDMIIPFLYNMKSIYQLLPSAELLSLQAEIEGQGTFYNGERVAAEDLFHWYCTRPFTSDTPLAEEAAMQTLSTRDIFADWQTYRDGFYVDKPEGKVFACDLVDTYYVAGTGTTTELGMTITAQSRTAVSGSMGDGTVPLLSATRGLNADNDHVFLVDGETHIPMGTHWDGGQMQAVMQIIERASNSYNEE